MSNLNHTQQIIQDAIQGGWKKIVLSQVWGDSYSYYNDPGIGLLHTSKVQIALLDPLFWEAVGKMRGWGVTTDNPRGVQYKVIREHSSVLINQEWKNKQYQFISYLQEGDDIETALSKLE